jgi:DNA-3-methyladenine glycosylase II
VNNLILKPRQPFSLAQTLRFILSPPALLNGRQFAPLLDYFEENEYRRVIEVGGHLILYGLTEHFSRSKALLCVRIISGPEDTATAEALRRVVARQFSTELDLRPFYRQARTDAVLSRLAAHFRGMRIPQAPTVFETVVSAILEQQVNLSFAHQVKKALIEAYGRYVEYAGRRYYTFPEPAALAIRTARELRRIQVSGPKARYIIALAQATLDGSLDLEGFRDLEPAAAYARLLHQKGVGAWTAQYVGLRALGHRDALPAADVGLQKALRDFYRLRQQPSAGRVEKLAQPWAGWRSYAAFYLWLTYWEDRRWKEQFIARLRRAHHEE